MVFLVAVFLRMSWPSLVPPGRGPDLTHHLLLVDYIQQHGHLVHDRSLDGAMGEMAHYTPASHLLAVVVGAAFGFDGLRAVFPLTAVCVALTAGFAFLIARRGGLPRPYASSPSHCCFFPRSISSARSRTTVSLPRRYRRSSRWGCGGRLSSGTINRAPRARP